MIKFFDYTRVLKPHKEEIYERMDRIFDDGIFILGGQVKEFEDKFAEYTGAKHALGVSSGTDALLTIFMALDLEPGDEVIVTPYTFVASITSIVRAGLKPVFVDVEKDSYHPTVDSIIEKWTDKTKAVLYVHLFGEAIDLDKLKKHCEQNDAFLIEDCAQSFGSKYSDGKSVGTIGDAGAFSFFPAKNLGCLGDGGMVITSNDALHEKVSMIRKHGSKKRYYHEILDGNFRLDTIQAAALNVLLPQIDTWVSKRKDNANYYLKNIRNNNIIGLPEDYPGNSWNQFVIRTKFRDELQKHLKENGVQTFIYWELGCHKQEVFKDEDFSKVQMNNTDEICDQVLALPVYPMLKEEERKKVVELINSFKVGE